MKKWLWLLALPLAAQFHRAEQDREIRYWLNDPATASFKISHDFTVAKAGQKHVHNFVRAGSKVSGAAMWNLDTGEALKTYEVTGAQVNQLGYYPEKQKPEALAVQGDLGKAIGAGESVRIRVEETYTDPKNYRLENGELVWERTLGRPWNRVTLPAGWRLVSVSTPAILGLDAEGRVELRFTNPRNDELDVKIRARRR